MNAEFTSGPIAFSQISVDHAAISVYGSVVHCAGGVKGVALNAACWHTEFRMRLSSTLS